MDPTVSEPVCPACGEPVKPTWKICPACEAPLAQTHCPGCGLPVKASWRICPECEYRLKPIVAETSHPVAAAAPARIQEPLTSMVLIRVPAGTFRMGDARDEGIQNEKPVHAIELDEFYMGRTPVTQAEWQRVMTENPSRFPGARRPVEGVSFQAVTGFLNRLNAAAPAGTHYELPTEAQWEYAARSGGRDERYAGGEDLPPLGWYLENSDERTHPVGEKAPNGLGVYDMSGNVWEWCRDIFRVAAYREHAPRNPCQTGAGSDRVIRGGGWNLDAWSARCCRRMGFPEAYTGPALGFRVVAVSGEIGLRTTSESH